MRHKVWRENEASGTHNLLDKFGKEITGRNKVVFLDGYVGRQKDRSGGKEVKIPKRGDNIILYTVESPEPNTVPGS